MVSEEELKKERKLIIKGLEETYKQLVEQKKLTNSPIIESRDGVIIEVNPKDIPSTTKYEDK